MFLGLLLAGAVQALEPGQLVTRGSAQAKRIALTFDDGPGPETEKFLDLLDRHRVRATFFLSGELVPLRPETVKKIVARGHELGSHTTRHTNYKAHQRQLQAKPGGSEAGSQAQARKDLLADLRETHAAIEKCAGVKVRFCRMPHGIDRPWIRDAGRQMGYTLVNWTYGADWNAGTAQELLPGYRSAIRPGAILLFHDGGRNRTKSLTLVEAVIRSAKEQGFELVTVGQLLEPPR